MSGDLKKSIITRVDIDDREWEIIDRAFLSGSCSKNKLLLEKGDVANHIYFVVEGGLYSFMEGKKENLVVQNLFFEGYWFGDLESFYSGDPTKRSILALEDVRFRYISKENFQALCNNSSKFERYFNQLIRNGYIRSLQRIDELILDSAEERYRKFMKHYSKYIQRIPLNVLASYVGVKPQSLSRIRNKIAKQN